MLRRYFWTVDVTFIFKAIPEAAQIENLLLHDKNNSWQWDEVCCNVS